MLLIVNEKSLIKGELIFNLAVVALLFSIVLHGIAAVPGINSYASSLKAKPDDIMEKVKK